MWNKKYIFPVLTLLAALVVEMLPFALPYLSMSKEGVTAPAIGSYFDINLFNSGEFGPFVTATFTSIMLLILLTLLVRKEPSAKMHKKMVIYCFVTLIANLTPLILGIEYYSVYAVLVSVLLLATGLLLMRMTEEVNEADKIAEEERKKWEKQVEKAKKARQAAVDAHKNSKK